MKTATKCAEHHWGLEQQDGSWVVTWRGMVFSGPRPSKAEAAEYIERLKLRYPNCSADALMSVVPAATKQKRGGPYVYELPTNRDYGIEPQGELHVSSMKEARAVLAKWLGRKRVPKGTVVRRKAA